ncbi:MAG: hypothetical protein J1G05_01255 [Clostridiales bacterium]|nr:hypothetical protein [Clostridiales bacterium]
MAEQNSNQTVQTTQTTQPASSPAPTLQQNTQVSAPAPAQSESPVAQTQEKGEEAKKSGKAYFIVALICTALGGLFFALTFTPLAVYSLLAAILFCIASISFLGTQKKRQNFKGVLILTIITYIIFVGLVAFFVGGVIWSMSAQ